MMYDVHYDLSRSRTRLPALHIVSPGIHQIVPIYQQLQTSSNDANATNTLSTSSPLLSLKRATHPILDNLR
eukprot:scaffold13313_cov314-Alexandrium_tamarense.AAC.4